MRKYTFIKFLAVFMVSVTLYSCSGYNKLLKSSDYDLKYEKGFEYYNKQKYSKALQIFEQITSVYRGLEKGEKLMFYYAMTNFKVKDYYSAGYYFRKFASTYPHSEYNEEAMFMSAFCYYLDSPKPSLDQESTDMAIAEFELFISKYPNTSRKDSCNMLLDQLRHKLQVKSYDNAYLYYKLGYYKAANVALKNSIKDYPDSPFKEEILYYSAKSMYLYADMSVNEKKHERFREAQRDLNEYAKVFPDGKFIRDVNKMSANTQEQLNTLPVIN
ncbi:MAG: outer membrane protein assembly factor BamD [Bacteroidales bacterium]|nr:outer membrane protein assembly factor BamD [Bacteroidales bacterium]